MKKIASLLTFVLVLALAVPAFAAEDNVEVTGDVKTTLEIADYGDNPSEAVKLWKNGDVLDLTIPDDESDLPAKKAFFQEIDFGITGNVNEDVTFDLALNTLGNSFTQIDKVDGAEYGEPNKNSLLEMDTATLTLADDVSTLKLGDISEFHADKTFINEEDREGLTLDTAVMGTDVSAFALGNDENGDEEFTGLTAEKDLGAATVTGKVLYADKFDDEFNVTNYVMAADADLTDVVAVNGKVVSNNWEEDANTDNNNDDTFMSAGVTVTPIDALTVNGSVEQVGENYKAVMDDTEGDNTNKYKVDADYDLNANNTVSGAYTVVAKDEDNTEDKSTSKVALDNTMGEFTNTASVEMTTNDGFTKDHNVTLVKLGTEYAMTDATTVTADLTNKTDDDDGEELSYNYLKAGVDTEVSENVAWNTEAQYVTGNTKDDVDATANSLTTSLDVSF